MSDPMRIRTQLSSQALTVSVLMTHPMETGRRQDAAGKPIPARYIQEVVASLNGKTVLTAAWGIGMAQNPVFQFSLQSAKVGDRIGITWRDNRGDSRTDEAVVS